MKTLLRIALPFAVMPSLALAIYAPVPEQEQGKALTVRLGAAAYHDSNIFGGATGVRSSMVYTFSAGIAFNGSISDQTFASASYDLKNDNVVDRPADKNLTSHVLAGRIAHSFSSATNLDVSMAYNIAKNPASLIPTQVYATDQSFKRLQFDGKFTTAAGQKTGIVAKYRYINYAYDTAALAADLDRDESLFGLEASYAFLPETKLVAEYRYQDIAYDTLGASKDKDSNFLLAGVDYNPGKDLLISARGGIEDRNRSVGTDVTSPYIELSARYTYSEGSFFATGYNYTIEEPSNVTDYTDTKVNRFFMNLQHRLSGNFTATGSLTYEPSQLQGRGTHRDDDEKTTRFGLGLSWLPTKNWALTGTLDIDEVDSDANNRDQSRNRYGVSARYTF